MPFYFIIIARRFFFLLFLSQAFVLLRKRFINFSAALHKETRAA